MKLGLNLSAKSMKHSKHFRTHFHKIDPSDTRIIFNKRNKTKILDSTTQGPQIFE